MSAHKFEKERSRITERLAFIDAVIASDRPSPNPDAPYGCQQYDASRMCRFDRRAIDRKCDGCERVTDRHYLESMGLWVPGVSHEVTA